MSWIILNSNLLGKLATMPPETTPTPERPDEVSYKIGIVLVGEMAKKFYVIKQKYGLQSNVDLLRLLISQKFEEFQIRDSPILSFQQKPITGP